MQERNAISDRMRVVAGNLQLVSQPPRFPSFSIHFDFSFLNLPKCFEVFHQGTCGGNSNVSVNDREGEWRGGSGERERGEWKGGSREREREE